MNGKLAWYLIGPLGVVYLIARLKPDCAFAGKATPATKKRGSAERVSGIMRILRLDGSKQDRSGSSRPLW